MTWRQVVLSVSGLCVLLALGFLTTRPWYVADDPAPAREDAVGDADKGEAVSADAPPRLVGIETGDAKTPVAGLARLRGKVIDGVSEDPVPGALVIAFRLGEKARIVRSDSGGRFEVGGLASGPWGLSTWHPRYVSLGLEALLAGDEVPSALPAAMQLHVPEGEGALPERILRVVPGRRLAGRVVDHQDTPVADADVLLWAGDWLPDLRLFLGIGFRELQDEFALKSDADGRFELACFPLARTGATGIVARKHGYACRWTSVQPAQSPANTAEVVLRMVQTASVTGHVRFADGRPAVGALVEFEDSKEKGPPWEFVHPDDAPVDEHGAYRMEGLPPTTVELGFHWRAPWLYGTRKKLDPLGPGEVRTGVDMTIQERFVLDVRLRSADGHALPGEVISLWSPKLAPHGEDEPAAEEATDEDGRVVFAMTSAGPYEIVHETPTSQTVLRSDVALPAGPLVLESKPGVWTSIELRVTGHDGAPVPRFSAEVRSLQGDVSANGTRFASSEDGEDGVSRHRVNGGPPFEINLEKPLTYDLAPEVVKLLERYAWRKVVVEEVPEAGRVDIQLHRAGIVFGRVTDEDGQPVQGVRLEVQHWMGGGAALPLTTGEDGRYELDVPSEFGDSFWLTVRAPDGYVGVESRAVRRTGDLEHDYVLPSAGTIAGRLVAPESVDLTNGDLVVVSWETMDADPPSMASFQRVRVDASGRFETDRVPRDRDLRVGIVEKAMRRLGLRVPADQERVRAGKRDLHFELLPGLTIRGALDFEGERLPHCSVSLLALDREGFAANTKVAADGRFAFTGLDPGTYLMRAGRFDPEVGYQVRLAERRVRAGDEVRFKIESRGIIRATVLGEAEMPKCVAWRSGTIERIARTSRTPAVLGDLKRDVTYDIVISAWNGVGYQAGVRAGQDVTIKLVPGVPLGGVLKTTKSLERVWMYARSEGACFDLDLAETGQFDTHVAPGVYDIILRLPDQTPHVVARGVAAGTTDLKLEYE